MSNVKIVLQQVVVMTCIQCPQSGNNRKYYLKQRTPQPNRGSLQRYIRYTQLEVQTGDIARNVHRLMAASSKAPSNTQAFEETQPLTAESAKSIWATAGKTILPFIVGGGSGIVATTCVYE